eukprot:264608-Rhodomonas_salina.1
MSGMVLRARYEVSGTASRFVVLSLRAVRNALVLPGRAVRSICELLLERVTNILRVRRHVLETLCTCACCDARAAEQEAAQQRDKMGVLEQELQSARLHWQHAAVKVAFAV